MYDASVVNNICFRYKEYMWFCTSDTLNVCISYRINTSICTTFGFPMYFVQAKNIYSYRINTSMCKTVGFLVNFAHFNITDWISMYNAYVVNIICFRIKGYIWFCTPDTLNVYNLYVFFCRPDILQVWSNPQRINNNRWIPYVFCTL